MHPVDHAAVDLLVTGSNRLHGGLPQQPGDATDQSITAREDVCGKVGIGEIGGRSKRQPSRERLQQPPIVRIFDPPPRQGHQFETVGELIILPQGIGDLRCGEAPERHPGDRADLAQLDQKGSDAGAANIVQIVDQEQAESDATTGRLCGSIVTPGGGTMRDSE